MYACSSFYSFQWHMHVLILAETAHLSLPSNYPPVITIASKLIKLQLAMYVTSEGVCCEYAAHTSEKFLLQAIDNYKAE